jgi:uncharacterized protein (DUF305 family)
MRKFSAVAALALGLSLALTGCGSDDSEGSSTTVSTTEHNKADVTFATHMIQQHAQALSMVDMTMGRDLDPKVAALAEDIRQAQAPEIETMSGWLQEWGEDIPETVRDHANAESDMEGMDSDTGTDLPGMMSDDDMAALEGASDAEFQDMWLEMMVRHHEGALQMAKTEEVDGQFKAAVDLSKKIQRAQTAEIGTLKNLLG